MSGMCTDCRHWGRHELSATPDETGNIKLARCMRDQTRASKPLMWSWEGCQSFAPDLRPYPHHEVEAHER